MNVTLLKKDGKKEVINRVELVAMANAIKTGLIEKTVNHTRELYHLMNPHRLPDGQVSTNWEGGIKLPRVCFAADYVKRKNDWKMMAYNGLVNCITKKVQVGKTMWKNCRRTRLTSVSSTLIYIIRHEGLIRVSLVSTSSSWSRDSTERCI